MIIYNVRHYKHLPDIKININGVDYLSNVEFDYIKKFLINEACFIDIAKYLKSCDPLIEIVKNGQEE